MTTIGALETALSPADFLRRRMLRALGPFAGRYAADREARVAIMGTMLMVTAFLGAAVAPLWVLALGPIFLGVPHLLADVRYLWVRPGLHRRWFAWLAIGGPMLLGLVTGRLVTGLAAAAGAALVARTSAPKRVAALVGIGGLMLAAHAYGPLSDILFAHAHNLIAVAMWWAWPRPERARKRPLHWVPLAAFAVLSLSLMGGVLDKLVASTPAFGPSMRYHAYVLAPGLDVTMATRLVLFFCFAQSVHYGVWLRLVPEEDRERRTPRTFAASARELVREMGIVPVLLTGLACIALVTWAVVDLGAARVGYLRAAVFHGQLELAAATLMLLQRGALRSEA